MSSIEEKDFDPTPELDGVDIDAWAEATATIIRSSRSLCLGFARSISYLLHRGEVDALDCLAAAPTIAEELSKRFSKQEAAKRRREFLENYPVDWAQFCDTDESRRWHTDKNRRRRKPFPA